MALCSLGGGGGGGVNSGSLGSGSFNMGALQTALPAVQVSSISPFHDSASSLLL